MNNPYFSLLRAIWCHGQSWRRSIVGYYLAYIVAQACLSLSPYAFGRTIDLLQHFQAEHLYDVIFWLGFGVIVLPLFWAFHGPARVVERKVALRIRQAFQINLYKQLTHLPLKWHQEHHSGNIITRINRASTSLDRFAADQFIYIETIVQFVVSIGFLLWISPPVGLLCLFTCLVASCTVIFFDRKLIPLYRAENEVENQVGSVFFDYVSNMTTILTLRLGSLTRHHLFQRLLAIWPFFNKEAVLNEVKWCAMGIILSSLQSIILVGYIVYSLKTTGTVMIGVVVMIFRYQGELSEVFYNLSTHYSELVRMDTDVKGVQPILDDIKQNAHTTQGASVARQWHTLTISDLVFQHASSESRGQINHITFDLKRGEKIALIGESGAGKSTLLNLLSGLYTPNHVQLTIDDVAFDSLEPMQAITTLIPQDPEIFENTIAFNITLELETGPDEINYAAKLAGFDSVLSVLPAGLSTDIREKGLNLSVGQKQRLALARGLFAARFSSLILMDEPTSSVDLATEKKILSEVIEHFSDATMIVSLHRLHLLPKFDRIIMLKAGEVVANGLSSELLSNSGPVRDLWQKYQSQTE